MMCKGDCTESIPSAGTSLAEKAQNLYHSNSHLERRILLEGYFCCSVIVLVIHFSLAKVNLGLRPDGNSKFPTFSFVCWIIVDAL